MSSSDADGDDWELFDNQSSDALKREYAASLYDAAVAIGVHRLTLRDDSDDESRNSKARQEGAPADASTNGGGAAAKQGAAAAAAPAAAAAAAERDLPRRAGAWGGGKETAAVPLRTGGHSRSQVPVEQAVPGIVLREFTYELTTGAVHGQVMVLEGSCYVHLGMEATTGPQGPLVAAIQTRYCEMPTVTPLLLGSSEAEAAGVDSDALSASVAQRLSRRSGAMVFCSCCLPETEEVLDVLPLLERKVLAALMGRGD